MLNIYFACVKCAADNKELVAPWVEPLRDILGGFGESFQLKAPFILALYLHSLWWNLTEATHLFEILDARNMWATSLHSSFIVGEISLLSIYTHWQLEWSQTIASTYVHATSQIPQLKWNNWAGVCVFRQHFRIICIRKLKFRRIWRNESFGLENENLEEDNPLDYSPESID